MLILIFGCKKNKANTETTISGKIIDVNFSKPVVNAKIFILKYSQTSDLVKSHAYLDKIVDSTLTDINGNYSFLLKTVETQGDYQLAYYLGQKFYNEYTQPQLKLGQNNIFDLNAYEYSYLKARIIYSTNSYPPLTVTTTSAVNIYTSLSYIKIAKVSGDTTVIMKIIPNHLVYITFSTNKGNARNPSYQETFTPPKLLDTLRKTFTIHPNTF